MARVGWIGSAAVVLFGVASAAIAAPSSVPATATPTTATVGVATPVVVSSLITDTTFISANLLRTDATGRSLSIVGTLHDDGLNGDAVAGDRIFSYSVSVSQAATGKVYYRVSAAFRGVLARVLSNVVAIDILPLKTAPQITLTLTPSPVNGWSRSAVTAHYTCTPLGSAIVSCPTDQVFSTDGTGFVATGTATDATGGTATATSQPFGIDRTTPGITVSLTPPVAPGSWTNQTVLAHFTCTDTGSGIATCPPDQSLSSDGANQPISGTAIDVAGNTATTQTTASIDRAPPSVSVSLSPAPDANGIYRAAVTAHFTCADALSGIASCPQDQLFSTAATGIVATGTASDVAGNTSTANTQPFTIQFATPTITVTLSPVANANGWNNGPVTAHFVCDENGQPLAGCPADIVTATEGANLTVSGSVTDASGVSASVTSGLFNIDLTPPAFAPTFPTNGAVVLTGAITVTGTAADALSGISAALCNGIPATVTGTSVSCPVQLVGGSNAIAVALADLAGNASTSTLSVLFQQIPGPKLTITSPANLGYFNITPTTVTGTVDDAAATVTVNSIAAPVVNGAFSLALPLAEGPNIVTATATNASGSSTASVTVTLDTAPPHVTITSPQDGFVTTDSAVSIAGIVNDIVVGTVNDQQAAVKVNGVQTAVANRTFLSTDVPLSLGQNTIQAVATDRVGNAATTQIKVTRLAPTAQPKIERVSGNNQTGTVGSQLAAPLVVALKDAAGTPVANKPVIFRVMQDDGLVADGGTPAPTAVVTTDSAGEARVQWTLGMRAGSGSNTLEAYAVGFAGTAVFTASGLQSAPAKIVVDTGDGQIGAIGQPLPRPLIAVVIDSGNNRLGGVPVTFTVESGGGSFAGQPSVTVNSDSDGRVSALLTLGHQEGNANNLVSASYTANQAFPASFTASGRVPGDPAQTTITGVVLDNSNNPVPGVTIRALLTNVANANATAAQTVPAVLTDAQGQFVIPQAPVGFIKILADGSTAQLQGTYPSLEYNLVTVAGQNNTVGQPIYLLPLSTTNKLCVTQTTGGGTLTIPEAPGFSLTFGPGQVTFPGGSKTGCVTVTVVNGDKVPMMPGFGQQPRFIVTIQPSGALFSPPAPITLPNVDGLRPREVTEMYSFDHDIASFVAIGTGVVSDDGQVIRSSNGVGVLKAGWHCGGNSNSSGTAATCPVCMFCQGTQCVPQGNGTSCGGTGSCQFTGQNSQPNCGCPAGQVLVNNSQCQTPPNCPSGTSFNVQSGQCCGNGQCQTPPNCPAGTTFNVNTGQCCGNGQCYTPPNCPIGTSFNSSTGQCCGNGQCQSPPNCQPGSTYNVSTGQCCSNGQCQNPPNCTPPQVLVNGTCQTPPQCPSGTTFNVSTGQCCGNGQCSCPSGQVPDPVTGQCQPCQGGQCPQPSLTITLSSQEVPPLASIIGPIQPVTVVVSTSPPTAGLSLSLQLSAIAGSGGHQDGAHFQGRPTGTFDQSTGVTDQSGTFTAHFTPDVIGELVDITAVGGSSPVSARISIKVPGLVPLGPGPGSHYRLVGGTPAHPSNSNHWGVQSANTGLVSIASDYHAEGLARGEDWGDLQFNDQSLPFGGKFDLRADWANAGSHAEHRVGVNCDVDRRDASGFDIASDIERSDILRQLFINNGSPNYLSEIATRNHWHLRFQ